MRIPLLSTAPVSPERAAEKKGLAFPAGTRYTCPGFFAGVMELVDVADSKSAAGDSVPVRVRSPAPRRRGLRIVRDDVFFFKANVIAHSLRRSSSPNRNRCAGLRFGAAAARWPFGPVSGPASFFIIIGSRRSWAAGTLIFKIPGGAAPAAAKTADLLLTIWGTKYNFIWILLIFMQIWAKE